MKVRARMPRKEGDEEALLKAMTESFPAKLFGRNVGLARVIDIGDDVFEIEIELDDDVDMGVDVGTYTAAGSSKGVDGETE